MASVVPVRFTFPGVLAPRAQRVAVVSSFNSWDAKAHTLTRTSGGDWSITVFLPPGRVVYRFCVDGIPWLDPGAESRLANASGWECSVRYVRNRMNGRTK
jgi:1,4-alpha-glucan branching enzyme